MTKIKYIHCFGTSFTAGGGFEFECGRGHITIPLKKCYSKLNEKLTQYNFSWPGRLQKLIGNDIKVFNHGKQGYGNERTIRLAYDKINEYLFNPHENLFIFEFSGVGRDEFFLKSINKHIVLNYVFDDSEGFQTFKFRGLAHDYFYDDLETEKEVEKFEDFFKTYVDNFLTVEEVSNKYLRNSELFIHYLKSLNINYLTLTQPIFNKKMNMSNTSMDFGDGKYFKKNKDFLTFLSDNDLTIDSETNGIVNDYHGSFKFNTIVSEVIFNKLIEYNYLNREKINIDWEYYSKTNLITTLI